MFSLSRLGHSVFGGWRGLLVLWLLLVKLHKFGQIESWFLEDLDLPDDAAIFLKWEDFSAALFLNLSTNISLNPAQINLIINKIERKKKSSIEIRTEY
jgi:hypothetical protein